MWLLRSMGEINMCPSWTLNLTSGVSMRLHRSKETDSLALLAAKRQTAHDLCSLAACNMAFKACRVGDGYDLGEFPFCWCLTFMGRSSDFTAAVWQLVALCTWIIKFLESLVKDCVVSHANNTVPPSRVKVEDKDNDLFGSASRMSNLYSRRGLSRTLH